MDNFEQLVTPIYSQVYYILKYRKIDKLNKNGHKLRIKRICNNGWNYQIK